MTRATVYRHFPDDEALFLACSGQWLARQRLPDPDAWQDEDPWVQLRSGLRDIYRYYRAGEPMLTMIHRDYDVVPERVRDARLEERTPVARDPAPRAARCPAGHVPRGGRARHVVRDVALVVRG